MGNKTKGVLFQDIPEGGTGTGGGTLVLRNGAQVG